MGESFGCAALKRFDVRMLPTALSIMRWQGAFALLKPLLKVNVHGSLNATVQALRHWGFIVTDEPRTIQWGHGTLAAEFSLTGDGVIRLARLGSPGDAPDEHHPGAAVPLVAVTAVGHGRW